MDQQTQAAKAAAAYAQSHSLMPLSISCFASRADSGDIDTLRQQRVLVVQAALINAGAGQMRIQVPGNGLLYPDSLPNQSAGQVDIAIGL